MEKDVFSSSYWKEHEKGIVKFYIELRRVFHGKHFLLFLTQLEFSHLTEHNIKYLIIPKEYYIASVLRSNNRGIVLKNGETQIE